METMEKPREVFLKACDEIAKRAEVHGFTYAKSGPHLTKKIKDLKFKISLSSSYQNVAGHYIAIRAHAHIESLALKKFRSNFHKNHTTSQVAVHDISSFEPIINSSEWNLADESGRASVIEQIINRIENNAIPFFNYFESPDLVAQKLVSEYVHYMHSMNRVITYLLFYTSEEMAKQSIIARLNRNKDEIPRYREALEYLGTSNPNDLKVYGFVEDMAYYSLVKNWGDLSLKVT